MAFNPFRKTDLLNEAHSIANGARSVFDLIVQDFERAANLYHEVIDDAEYRIRSEVTRRNEAQEALVAHQATADKVKSLVG